jgi:membrane-bound lytic murein transglycosylase D
MLKYQISILYVLITVVATASPRVPGSMEFAGIKLTINETARKQIQDDVDALHRNQTYFSRKVEKVDLFFPIIERIFREENIPDDFKYLVIQESALIADAVSTSNAVGFWQFKEMTAKEVGLIVDRNIDERMNITSSTRGAAKYLKKNNFFFDNWLYALLAYNTGPGGAEQHIDKKYLGSKKMEITKQTHWYVKKFLAHKIAFESHIGKNQPALTLYEYHDTHEKSLKDLSDFFKIDHEIISEYNKWLKKGKVPSDKTYTAIIPVTSNDQLALSILSPDKSKTLQQVSGPKIAFQNTYMPVSEFNFSSSTKYPQVKKNPLTQRIKINGIPGFIASPKDRISTLAIDHGITKKDFIKYNDMVPSDEIIEGEVYYLKPKKSKANIHYHVVIPGESAWSISQKYGIKLKSFLTKNRMQQEKELASGMVVWLRFIRPPDVPVEYRESAAQNVVVKSYSNEAQQPRVNEANTQMTKKPSSAQPINTSENADLVVDSEFLFQELNDNTEFIDQNSFINLEKENKKKATETPPKIASEPFSNTYQAIDQKTKIYHIVKTGETLFSISRLYDVSIGEMRQWNDFGDLDVLSVGQRITVYTNQDLKVSKPDVNTAGKYTTYIVKRNDTLYSIARTNGLTIKELMDLNQKEDFIINEGEILKIKVSD